MNNIGIDPLTDEALISKEIEADVLRLDKIHPQISGNKWYKLKGYLQQAQQLHKKTIVTFGGAFSNHILATAAACSMFGFRSVGIIRGEKSSTLSPTLQDALGFGMELIFVSRTDYKLKQVPPYISQQYPDSYIINEGGYGKEGMIGVREILSTWNNSQYTHICAAVGTGTTLAGLITSALPHQKIVGISVLKNNFSLENDVIKLAGYTSSSFEINHHYHFGGYAKQTPQLIEFVNDWYRKTGIPSDFVYTGKLFYAIHHLIKTFYFPQHSKLLIIHSGGLQGNRSLPAGTLIY